MLHFMTSYMNEDKKLRSNLLHRMCRFTDYVTYKWSYIPIYIPQGSYGLIAEWTTLVK